MPDHAVILLPSHIGSKYLLTKLLNGQTPCFNWLSNGHVGVFSDLELEKFMEEENVHDLKILTKNSAQNLATMSSGERKKAFLAYLLSRSFEAMILVNPFDNLDKSSRQFFTEEFTRLSLDLNIVQIVNRTDDTLPFIKDFYLAGDSKKVLESVDKLTFHSKVNLPPKMKKFIPPPLRLIEFEEKQLVSFKFNQSQGWRNEL